VSLLQEQYEAAWREKRALNGEPTMSALELEGLDDGTPPEPLMAGRPGWVTCPKCKATMNIEFWLSRGGCLFRTEANHG
jgi:hypothetical protein